MTNDLALAAHSVGYRMFADLPQPFTFDFLFKNRHSIEVEIGAGRGDFATSYAAVHPEINFVAIERKLTYLKRGVSKADNLGLGNVCFLNLEVRHFFEHYLQAGSVDVVHMYFPDPWPKKRHLRRRLMQADFLREIERVLRPGGYFHLRTDHAEYFDQMLEVMSGPTAFTEIDTNPEITSHLTGFEKRFMEKGFPIYRRSYQRNRIVLKR